MTAYKYVGDGSYLMGVPARDLTAEEAEHHKEALSSPQGRLLYEAVAKTSRKAKGKAAAESED